MKINLLFSMIWLLSMFCILTLTTNVNAADPPKVGAIVRVLYSNLGGDSYANGVSSFDIHHARPYLKGALLEGKLVYKLMFGFDKDFTSTNVLDAFGDYKLNKNMSVRFGQFKAPFDRQFLTPLTALQFVNRGAGGLKSFNRDRGVTIHGTLTKFFITYDVGVFNGTGINKSFNAKNKAGNDDQQHLFTGRVTVNPQGVYGYKLALPGKADKLKTSFGFGFATGQISNDSTDVVAYCCDFSACAKGFTTMLEYQNKQIEDPVKQTTTTGVTGQLGYFFQPKMEAVARYSDKKIKDGTQTTGITFGLTYYFASNNAKCQLNYTMANKQPVSGDKSGDNKIYLLYQMVF